MRLSNLLFSPVLAQPIGTSTLIMSSGGPEKKPITCPGCSKVYASRSGLAYHRQSTGCFAARRKEPNLRFSCGQCPKWYAARKSLQKHILESHGQPSRTSEASPPEDFGAGQFNCWADGCSSPAYHEAADLELHFEEEHPCLVGKASVYTVVYCVTMALIEA